MIATRKSQNADV